MADAEMDVKILMGTFYQSVDVKGRMTFPAKLRECIGERFIVTRGSADCLFVYARDDFYRRAAKISKLPMSESRDKLLRSFTANAAEVEPDKQGRILIPGPLREYAFLDKEAVVIGVSDRCEIWDKKRWDDFNNSIDMGELLKSLEGLDF
ncbi:MraZ protein [Ruminococcaceae bacterium FB2012]|nr:MraZ protein [Ruminococcaceae bacterium FB2012]